MVIDPDPIRRLFAIPAFVNFAHTKMEQDADFWRHESRFGIGIMRAAAIAVVEICRDDET